MSSGSRVHWIKPFEEQAIFAKPDILLQPSDVIPDWMDFVWVFPGPLDESKLCKALSRTLHDFYHAAGRVIFNKQTGKWSITFADNRGVPLTIGSTALPSVMDPNFNHERHPDYVDKHPYMINPDATNHAELPLITLKVVECISTQETTMTLGYCHICGDCTSMTHLMNSFSLYYQGIEPIFKPTFDKYTEPDQTIAQRLIPEIMPYLYAQEHAIDSQKVIDSLEVMASTTSRISLRLSAQRTHAISAWVKECTKVRGVSETDTIIGFVSACISSVSPANVNRIAYILGTRGVRSVPESSFKPPSMTTMGNCMQTVGTEKVIEPTPWAFADAMRTSINRVRDPETLGYIVALHSHMLQRPGLVPDYLNLTSPDTVVYINALNKIPVLKAHFGYPESVRFYLYGSAEHFVSMLPANPTLQGGQWVADCGGIDVVFRLKHDRVEKFWKVFDEMVQSVEQSVIR